MDVIIVCHTEFGYVQDRQVIFEKNPSGVEEGVPNLVEIADKHYAKITFVVCPEVLRHFPKDITHEIGLHVHPGWQKFRGKKFEWQRGDLYLKEHCPQSVNSTVLRDYPFAEQLNLISTAKEYLEAELEVEARVFVAGRWSENNDTVKALVATKFTHDCTPTPHSKPCHHDWSKLPRICMPYHPSKEDCQEKGSLPLLFVPISQFFPVGNVNPEVAPICGLPWLKACFTEYYHQNLPLFHICLHSPSMTDPYFLRVMDELLTFISAHENVSFRFASEVEEYQQMKAKTNILPYLFGVNKNAVKAILQGKGLAELR